METMIILGTLLGLIILFLFVQWILGMRKKKKAKKANEQFLVDQEKAKFEVVASISAIIEKNKDMLDNFVVSVGEYKMKDINEFAKLSLKKIQNTNNYNIFFKNEDFPLLADTDKYVENLKKTKSNLWEKNCIVELDYFEKHQKELETREDFAEIKKNAELLLQDEMSKWKNDFSK